MRVAIVLFDGFDNLDAIGPFEVFSHARTFGADIDVGLYSPTPQEEITSSHGLRIRPDGSLFTTESDESSQIDTKIKHSLDVPDLVLVPGGGWDHPDREGARMQVNRGHLPQAVKTLHEGGSAVASVCTGGMIIASAGLTRGRPAVTHRSALDDLHEAGAEVIDARVVDDGDLITAGGVTAGIDLALHIVEREFGADISRRVATEMEHEPRGDVYQT